MSFDINGIFKDLESGAIDAARDVAINELKIAAHDAIDFVSAALPALGRYLNLLVDGKISEDEFKSLVYGLRDLAELNGLTQAGLTAIQIDQTKNAILKTVTSIALGAISKIT
jgi:hypothetical protein